MPEKDPTYNNLKLSKFGEYSIRLPSFIDKTPLKYFGSGYWVEKYGLEAKEIMNEFEKKLEKSTPNSSELEELVSEYETKIKKTTSKGYGNWMIRFFPAAGASLLTLPAYGDKFYNMINNQIDTPYLGEIVAGLGIVCATAVGAFILHDFACPSSIRKFLDYQKKGDDRMCKILNWAGFNPISEFDNILEKHHYKK